VGKPHMVGGGEKSLHNLLLLYAALHLLSIIRRVQSVQLSWPLQATWAPSKVRTLYSVLSVYIY